MSPHFAARRKEETMKAAYLVDDPDYPQLTLGETPQPIPGDGEILIQVIAAGVTPTELLWYPTFRTKDGQRRIHAIPGHEFSGVIAGLGRDVQGFSVGDEVYGMNDWFAQGATAEYCVAVASGIALKPAILSHTEAATIPIGGLTAWQGLFDRAKLQIGERVLVHGGAGAVGAFVIQIAKLQGADVIATATGRNIEFVKSLGADEVIDYKAAPFEELVSHIDILFDAVGGETLQRSWKTLGPNGRAVTIASESEGTLDERTKKAFFIVEPNRKQLENIGVLINGGALHSFVGAIASLSDAPVAYAGKFPRNDRYGKIVITMAASER
jgi:NADPH:quinone reductase-like Zn-dependent oxidoreductase